MNDNIGILKREYNEFKKIEDEAKLLISRRAAELREAIRMADYR